MKKRISMGMVLLLVLSMSAFAASRHDHGSSRQESSAHGSDHAQGDHDSHAGMVMGDGMAMIGSMSSKGVKGMAHISDVSKAMSKAGQAFTHHFMIVFVDEKSGEQIAHGTVALKVTDPDGKNLETVELVGMDGHFGVDLVLDKLGEYHFKLGSQLADGTKRKYHFHHVVK